MATSIPNNRTRHTDRSVFRLWRAAAVLGYGVAAYLIGVAALLALILATFGIIELGAAAPSIEGVGAAIGFNAALLFAFAAQHSVMARKSFKERWTRIVRPSMERATYLIATAAALLPLLAFWQPLPQSIWSVEAQWAQFSLYGVAAFGWAYLFASSFAIDHFELFGLKQVWHDFRGTEPRESAFSERWMYRFDRHPIMTGVLLGLWSTPHMTLGHLTLAIGLSVYVIIGVHFEERALLREHGDRYAEYRSRVPSLVPTFH